MKTPSDNYNNNIYSSNVIKHKTHYLYILASHMARASYPQFVGYLFIYLFFFPSFESYAYVCE